MFETIAILVIFFILVVFGFMFYTRVQKGTFQAEAEEKIILKSVDLSETIFFLPELQCIGTHDIDCIDVLKLNTAKDIIGSNALYYFNILGYSHVYVKEIYSGMVEDDLQEFDLYDFSRKEDRGKISTQFPISIHDPRTDKYSFGVLFIDIYR